MESDNEHERSYRYIDDDDLQKDFITGAGLSETNIPNRVYFYFYSIIFPKVDSPVLKVYLNVGADAAAPQAIPDFHSIEIDKTAVLSGIQGGAADDGADLNDLFLEECMEKLTTTILNGDHEIASNYSKYYKGFIMNGDKLFIVFELPPNFSGMLSFYIDEILNKTSVGSTVRDFFYANQEMIYITKENYENYEIPQVFYGESEISRKMGEYGYFYSFKGEPYENSVKYIGFVEDKTYYDNGENINQEFDACVIYSFKTNEWYFKSRDFFSIAAS